MRITDKEAETLFGLVKNSEGIWVKKENLKQNDSTTNDPLATNSKPRDTRKSTKSKRGAGNKSARKATNKRTSKKKSDKDTREFRVFVTAYNVRDMDPDNVLPKWYIDKIVEAGIVPDDKSHYIKGIEKRVIIVDSEEEERVLIEVFEKVDYGKD